MFQASELGTLQLINYIGDTKYSLTWCPTLYAIQSGYIGCNTGNGEKLSNSQACCLAQLCLAAA